MSNFKKIRTIKIMKKALFLATIFNIKKIKSKFDKSSSYDKLRRCQVGDKMDLKNRPKIVRNSKGCFYVDNVRFDYWIYRNLRDYGNCVIPNFFITLHGLERIEELLSILMKKDVIVHKAAPLKHKDVIYMATIEKKKTKTK